MMKYKSEKCFSNNKHGSALIMVVLMFAILLVLGTGAGIVAASSSHNSIRETKNEQAYIAARSVALAVKDEIVNSSNVQDTIEKLRTANAVNAGFLDGASYDLDITDLTADEVMFSVTAVTSTATDTYSFVMTKTETANPQVLGAVSFMLAHTVTGQLDSPIYGSIYLHDIGNNNNNTVVLKADIYGSVFINEPKNGNTISFELGRIRGDQDFLDVSKTLGLIAGSNVELKIPVDGDVYIKGDLDMQNLGTINGDVYLSGNIKNHSGRVTGTIYSGINNTHAQYSNWQEHIDILSYYAQKGNIMNRPDWAVVDAALLTALNGYSFAPITPTPATQTISQNYKLDVSKLGENGPTKVIIDATGASNGLNIVLTENKNNVKNITLKNVKIETKGIVRFYLPDGVNLKFENGGSIVTEDAAPTQLTNYLIGLGQNNIHLSSGRGSLYAFVYIQPQGNDTGWGSGTFRIEGEALPGYDKLFGSVYSKEIILNPASNSPLRYGGTDGFSSGDLTYTSTVWQYNGVIS